MAGQMSDDEWTWSECAHDSDASPTEEFLSGDENVVDIAPLRAVVQLDDGDNVNPDFLGNKDT